MKNNISFILTLLLHQPVPAQSHTGFEQYYCPGATLATASVTRAWYAIGKSYVEARYNYDAQGCIGFSAGKRLGGTNAKGWDWSFTPTAGVVTGRSQGYSLGVNIALRYRGWNFSSAAQVTPARTEGYGYSWSELGRSAGDKAYFGVALQQDCRPGTGCAFSPGVTGQLTMGGWTFPLYVFEPFGNRVWLLMGVTREWALRKNNVNQKNSP